MIPILIAFGGITLVVWYFANNCCPHKATPVTGLSPDQTHQPLRQTPKSNPVKPQPKPPVKGTYKPVRNTTADQAKPTPRPAGPKGGGGPFDWINNGLKGLRESIAKGTGTPDLTDTAPKIPGLYDQPKSPFIAGEWGYAWV